VHNRFGTLSIRHLAKLAIEADNDGASTWLSELIWRDFYFQIIANFPHVSEKKSFKSQFENLKFENDEKNLKHGRMV
jgi:deoxyribodipyrimidine photo-lyase